MNKTVAGFGGLILLAILLAMGGTCNKQPPVVTPQTQTTPKIESNQPQPEKSALVKSIEAMQAQKAFEPSPASEVSAEQPPLELLSYHFSRDASGDFAKVEGYVQNITNQNLGNVLAVVSFYDKNKNILTSANALLSFLPLSSKQISPFKVMTQYNYAMDNVDIKFKAVSGEAIAVKYRADAAY